MSNKRRFSIEEARAVGMHLGIDWTTISLKQFRRGLEIELEHGAIDPETNVTGDDLVLTGKIAWAHLKEIQDYYTRLDRLEAEAEGQSKVNYPIEVETEGQPTVSYRLEAEAEEPVMDGYLAHKVKTAEPTAIEHRNG